MSIRISFHIHRSPSSGSGNRETYEREITKVGQVTEVYGRNMTIKYLWMTVGEREDL